MLKWICNFTNLNYDAISEKRNTYLLVLFLKKYAGFITIILEFINVLQFENVYGFWEFKFNVHLCSVIA